MIELIPYPLGMLITAFLVLVAIKLVIYLWPNSSRPTRKHALLVAAVTSIYGPAGIVSMMVIILAAILIKLGIFIFSNSWWDKPL